jgi:hypothetical protein
MILAERIVAPEPKPAQVGEDTLHWSVLGLVTKELKSSTVVGNE